MKNSLRLIAFVSGAVVMILELVGSRIVAPYLGTSTIIWTSLIGVILASLSLGYFWGGKLADKYPKESALSAVLLSASFFILLLTYFKPLLFISGKLSFGLLANSVITTVFLFMPATVALGMVTPFVVRLAIKDLDTSGATVGRLYALSTLGSIIGTFLGGFVLISLLGSTTILFALSLVLIITAFPIIYRNRKSLVVSFFIVVLAIISILNNDAQAIAPTGFSTIYDVDTRYSRVWIYDGEDFRTGRPIRLFTNSVYAVQSGAYLDEPTELLFDYTNFFNLPAIFKPDFKRVLLVGAGAYSYPKYFAKNFPTARMDIVEIDSALEDIAGKFFSFQDTANLTTYNADGRVFLNQDHEPYDAILLDAFSAEASIPYQLVTLEAVKRIERNLADDGLLIVNIISALEGRRSGFFKAFYRTLKEVFPEVLVFQVNALDTSVRQNIIIAAFRKDVDERSYNARGFEEILERSYKGEINLDKPILTDDFAPVEFYSSSVF